MIRHDWADLWLHTDDELAALLGSAIIERETLHEWPLSCVQRITTADGQRRIYKSQHALTVEPAFYAAAKSPLLPLTRILSDDPPIMLLDFIDAPPIPDLSESEALELANRALAAIRQIEGNPPVWLDISGAEVWRSVMAETLAALGALVADGKFTQVDVAAVALFERCVSTPAILALADGESGLVHGDLNRENLFLLSDGAIRVIDWSRPFRGPAALDQVTLMESFGFERGADTPIVAMSLCLRIHWLAACAVRWFPPGVEVYDEQIAELIDRLRG